MELVALYRALENADNGYTVNALANCRIDPMKLTPPEATLISSILVMHDDDSDYCLSNNTTLTKDECSRLEGLMNYYLDYRIGDDIIQYYIELTKLRKIKDIISKRWMVLSNLTFHQYPFSSTIDVLISAYTKMFWKLYSVSKIDIELLMIPNNNGIPDIMYLLDNAHKLNKIKMEVQESNV